MSPERKAARRKADRERQRLKREQRKVAGICYYCNNPVSDNGYMCTECICKRKVARDKRRSLDQCFDCTQPALPGKTRCEKHSTSCKEALSHLYKRWKEEGRCPGCGKPSDNGKVMCSVCRKKNSAKILELKVETFNAYGGCRCACCGTDLLEHLSIEHPNGDGKAHREAFGGKGGYSFYRKLRKLGFPNDPPLEVLCYNCNCSRGFFGYCPHDLQRTTPASICVPSLKDGFPFCF